MAEPRGFEREESPRRRLGSLLGGSALTLYARARQFLDGFAPHLSEAGIGTISEIFDADAPYTPRGCVAQAWSVAEVLRSLEKIESRGT